MFHRSTCTLNTHRLTKEQGNRECGRMLAHHWASRLITAQFLLACILGINELKFKGTTFSLLIRMSNNYMCLSCEF